MFNLPQFNVDISRNHNDPQENTNNCNQNNINMLIIVTFHSDIGRNIFLITNDTARERLDQERDNIRLENSK